MQKEILRFGKSSYFGDRTKSHPPTTHFTSKSRVVPVTIQRMLLLCLPLENLSRTTYRGFRLRHESGKGRLAGSLSLSLVHYPKDYTFPSTMCCFAVFGFRSIRHAKWRRREFYVNK
jgi:hypothetical protein